VVAAGDDGDCSGDDGVSSAWKQSAQLGARMQLRTGSTLALKQLMILIVAFLLFGSIFIAPITQIRQHDVVACP